NHGRRLAPLERHAPRLCNRPWQITCVNPVGNEIPLLVEMVVGPGANRIARTRSLTISSGIDGCWAMGDVHSVIEPSTVAARSPDAIAFLVEGPKNAAVYSQVPGALLRDGRGGPRRRSARRSSQTVRGRRQACPPEIFADIGDAMMSDSRPIIVTNRHKRGAR